MRQQAQLRLDLRRAERRVQLPAGGADHPLPVRLVQEQPVSVRDVLLVVLLLLLVLVRVLLLVLLALLALLVPVCGCW